MITFFRHNHKWQTRGVNRYGLVTYRVCLKCGQAEERVNQPGEDDKFSTCERMPELDNQFDEKGNYIFNN